MPAPTPVPTPTPAPTPSGPPVVTVGIPTGASFLTTTAYIPNAITVAVGTTVTWTNNDNVGHTVSSQNNLWDSGDMEPGVTFSRTFQSAGTFPYYCVYHPLMVGTITVH
jgi:plastocyanin